LGGKGRTGHHSADGSSWTTCSGFSE
jgi:hypothetical protein